MCIQEVVTITFSRLIIKTTTPPKIEFNIFITIYTMFIVEQVWTVRFFKPKNAVIFIHQRKKINTNTSSSTFCAL